MSSVIFFPGVGSIKIDCGVSIDMMVSVSVDPHGVDRIGASVRNWIGKVGEVVND